MNKTCIEYGLAILALVTMLLIVYSYHIDQENVKENSIVCTEIEKLVNFNLTLARSAELRGDSRTAKQLRDNVKAANINLKDVDCKD